MDLRAIQKPLKEKYRSDPNSSRITLRAHSGVGGPGTAACDDLNVKKYFSRGSTRMNAD
jgi:hypothetical protein